MDSYTYVDHEYEDMTAVAGLLTVCALGVFAALIAASVALADLIIRATGFCG